MISALEEFRKTRTVYVDPRTEACKETMWQRAEGVHNWPFCTVWESYPSGKYVFCGDGNLSGTETDK